MELWWGIQENQAIEQEGLPDEMKRFRPDMVFERRIQNGMQNQNQRRIRNAADQGDMTAAEIDRNET
jgi:hypothetical protein